MSAQAPSRLSVRREDGTIRPGWAVLIFVLMTAAGGGFEAALTHLFLGRSFWWTVRLGDPAMALPLAGRAAWALGATWLACRVMNWPLGDAYLRDPRWWLRVSQGVVLAVGMFGAVVLVPLELGYARFSLSTGDASAIAVSFLWAALTCACIALSEELWMRGYALRQLHRAIGRWGAAAATGVCFGLMHGANPGASWLAIANVALVGVWLALTVQRTGSLWLAVGFHFAWNLVEGCVWGMPLSGHQARATILVSSQSGGARWTGGDFGPEASIPSAMLLAVMILLFALWPRRRPGVTPSPGTEAAPG